MMDGSRTVLLCKRGRTLAHAVTLDGSVDVREFPVRAWWKPTEYGLRPMWTLGPAIDTLPDLLPYPVDAAALKLLVVGNTVGITERARRLLIPLLGVPRNLDDKE